MPYGSRGNLHTDESGADHHYAGARHQLPLDRVTVLNRAQTGHRGMSGTFQAEQAGTRAGCQDQCFVRRPHTVIELDPASDSVDTNCLPAGQQFDAVLRVPVRRAHPGNVLESGLGQKTLRQRRPLVRRVRFFADERDRAGVSAEAQGLSRAPPGLAGTNNHHRRVRLPDVQLAHAPASLCSCGSMSTWPSTTRAFPGPEGLDARRGGGRAGADIETPLVERAFDLGSHDKAFRQRAGAVSALILGHIKLSVQAEHGIGLVPDHDPGGGHPAGRHRPGIAQPVGSRSSGRWPARIDPLLPGPYSA